MGSFLSAIFGGQNKVLNSDINQSGAISGYDTGVGEGLTSAGAQFQEGILSGDPTKEAEALAPETAAAQQQKQQQKDTLAQFGPRSGGTAAFTAGLDANTRGQLIKMLGGLKSSTAGEAVGEGTNLTGQALSANAQQADESQQRMQNWQDSILGQGTQYAAGAAEAAALKAIGL